MGHVLSGEVIVGVVFGITMLAVGLLSLWQGRRRRLFPQTDEETASFTWIRPINVTTLAMEIVDSTSSPPTSPILLTSIAVCIALYKQTRELR